MDRQDYYLIWKNQNPNYFKDYWIKNREKLNNYHDKWVEANKEQVKKYQREYHKKYYIEKRLKEQNKKIEAFKLSLKS
jgi:hypothetical protein